MRWSLLPERAIRPYLLVAVAAFLTASVVGFYAPAPLRAHLTAALTSLVQPYRELATERLFAAILFHNAAVALLALVLGLLLGILPLLSVGANGFILGVVWRQASRWNDPVEIARAILPHGIFELPAFLLTASYGMWLGMAVLRRARGKEGARIADCLRHALLRYAIIVLPLLTVAAAIESFLVRRPM